MSQKVTVAIHQPNYLPWSGFFNKLARSDVFVLLDDVQLSRGKSYTSRVQIKTPQGAQWLTVPVQGKGELKNINQVVISGGNNWQRKHWNAIQLSYQRSAHFQKYAGLFAPIYADRTWTSLAELNIRLIETVTAALGVDTKLVRSSQLSVPDTAQEKLLGIVKRVGADIYLTGDGRGSQRYVDEETFAREGIRVVHQEYVPPAYPQQWDGFVPGLSIIDLLFNCGEESRDILLDRS